MNINPRQMQQMMKKMGIQQQEIDAYEVVIRCPEKEIIITNPSVSKVNAMGQITFQISGDAHERANSTTPEISNEDVQTVMEQAKVNRETALKAIEDAKGDLAEAILKLQQ